MGGIHIRRIKSFYLILSYLIFLNRVQTLAVYLNVQNFLVRELIVLFFILISGGNMRGQHWRKFKTAHLRNHRTWSPSIVRLQVDRRTFQLDQQVNRHQRTLDQNIQTNQRARKREPPGWDHKNNRDIPTFTPHEQQCHQNNGLIEKVCDIPRFVSRYIDADELSWLQHLQQAETELSVVLRQQARRYCPHWERRAAVSLL